MRISASRGIASHEAVRSVRPMSPEVRESRTTLILLAVSVGAVLLFGAFTLLTQIG